MSCKKFAAHEIDPARHGSRVGGSHRTASDRTWQFGHVLACELVFAVQPVAFVPDMPEFGDDLACKDEFACKDAGRLRGWGWGVG